jgi:hypothetical protein
MPGTVEAAAIKPISKSDAPRLSANSVRVGLLDIVELKIANKPITERYRNGADVRCEPWFISKSPVSDTHDGN